jgi:hypothetical protein
VRRAPLILLCAALGSCATRPEPDTRTAANQRAFEALVAGKVAGAPLSCLPSFDQFDMQVIDGRTVAYSLGSKTTYMVQLTQGCGALGSGGYTLVTRQLGGTGLCRGDSASVVDLASRTHAGFCMVQQITPYNRSG